MGVRRSECVPNMSRAQRDDRHHGDPASRVNRVLRRDEPRRQRRRRRLKHARKPILIPAAGAVS